MSNTNASVIQRGFHYQDMVGLIEFLDNIENVKAVNVEGKDDIDLIFENDRIYYYQAKETSKPHEGKMSGEFKDALKTLNNDAEDENMERIVYVSNSTQPLGDLKGSRQFVPSYALYNYDELEPNLQKKVIKHISKNVTNNLDKLFFLKISYEGSDDRTKLREFTDRVDEFVEKTKLNGYKRELANEWQQMIIRSNEEESRTVAKEDFYAHTVITVIFSNKTKSKDFEDFLESFDVDYENECYIKEQYNELVDGLYTDFDLVNTIYQAHQKFQIKHSNLPRRIRLKKFIEEFYPVLKEKLNYSKTKDNDIVKFIIWLAIKSYNLANDIKEAIGYANN